MNERSPLIWILAGAGALLAAELYLRVRHRRQAGRADTEGLRPETRRLRVGPGDRRLRIVALGDSITHGYVLPAEQTYPALLGQRWRAALPDRPLLVINAGVCGDTAVQGLLRVERDALRFRPAWTLIAFGLNDAALGRSGLDVARAAGALPAGLLAIVEQLHLVQTARAWARRWGLLRRLPLTDYWPELPRVAPADFRAALLALTRRIRRQGGRVCLLTTHPVRHETAPAVEALAACNALIRQTAAESGAALIDVERAFAGREMAGLLDWDGVHLTPAGQSALADVIAVGLLGHLARHSAPAALETPVA
jgi:lysophospholipase L1-like esterase